METPADTNFKNAESLLKENDSPTQTRELIQFVKNKSEAKKNQNLSSATEWKEQYLIDFSNLTGIHLSVLHIEDSFHLIGEAKKELIAHLYHFASLKINLKNILPYLENHGLSIFIEPGEIYFFWQATVKNTVVENHIFETAIHLVQILANKSQFSWQYCLSSKSSERDLFFKFVFKRGELKNEK